MQAFARLGGYRLSYFDTGLAASSRAGVDPDGAVVFMVHGNLTGGLVFHEVIRLLRDRYRCLAPDLLGFGMSDMPEAESVYTLARHIDLIARLVEELDLHNMVLCCHDWGGPIGLGAALRQRFRFRGLAILNTLTDPVMQVPARYRLPLTVITRWRYASNLLVRKLGLFQRLGLRSSLDRESRQFFARANHDASTRAGIAAFPRMIPTSRHHASYELLRTLFTELEAWDVPSVVAFSDRDRIFSARAGAALARRMKDARFERIRGARHFVQHEAPNEVARIVDSLAHGASPMD